MTPGDILSASRISCLIGAVRNTSVWLFMPPLTFAFGCFSPNLPPNVAGDETVGTGSSSSDAAEGSSQAAGSEAGTADTDVTVTSSTSLPGTNTSDDGVDGSTGTQCATADDCGPTLLCIDSVCGPCDGAADPDAACSAVSPDQPICGGTAGCVACTPDMCTGSTPACDPEIGCVACVEHAQCPDSACHLLGPEAGSCFEVADVVEVTDAVEFQAEFGALGPGDQRVFRVSGALPGMGSYSLVGLEIAILGDPGADLMGGFTNLFFIDPDSLLYVAGVRISDGANRAFNNAGGLWLDDVDISAFTVGVLSSGDLRVRRSRVTAEANGGLDGVAIQLAGSLYAENSAFGPDATVGLRLDDGASLDLRYVTIAGNETAAECGNQFAGAVRNSIVSSTTAASLTGCGSVDWIDTAVDEIGYGEVIGGYDGGWFVDAPGGDFHLTAAGAVAIGDIADWDEGDPIVDIDGDLRPTKSEGRPGLDEP